MQATVTPRLVALAALLCASPLRAHHSISMFDISTPIWVKGTVVNYAAANPHALIALEAPGEDGQVQRWTVEGPAANRLNRMQIGAEFLKGGEVIEVCGFAVKQEILSRPPPAGSGGFPPRFLHGHLLVMPDGRMQPWGPYGKLDNCLRTDDKRQAWVDFLNGDAVARELWCGRTRLPPATSVASADVVDAINRSLATPCP